MRTSLVRTAVAFAFAMVCCAVEPEANDVGKKMEQAACTPCHSMRLIDSQRLLRCRLDERNRQDGGLGSHRSKQAGIDRLSCIPI